MEVTWFTVGWCFKAALIAIVVIFILLSISSLFSSLLRRLNFRRSYNDMGRQLRGYSASNRSYIFSSSQKDIVTRTYRNQMLNEISELTYNMDKCKRLPAYPKLGFVNFYALGRKGKFGKIFTYPEIHFSEHPYYPVYIYFTQLINEIRKVAIEKLGL